MMWAEVCARDVCTLHKMFYVPLWVRLDILGDLIVSGHPGHVSVYTCVSVRPQGVQVTTDFVTVRVTFFRGCTRMQ